MLLPEQPITELLHAWREGDEGARDAVMAAVYDQLRLLAGRCLSGEKPGQTLQATAIVHEAYLRLVKSDVSWENRVHFFMLAARLMRRILVDHARTKHREKRGGGAVNLSLDEALAVSDGDPEPLLELDAALDRLGAFDPRKCQIVELFYYGGMTQEEIAAALKLSSITISRELKMARAWLHSELRRPV